MSNREAGPEHECRQGRRCKARRRTPANEWQPAGVERPNTLCRSCEEAAFGAIRELGDLYLQLWDARTEEKSHLVGPKVSGTSQRSIPINLAVDTLMTAIDDEALRWANYLTRGEPLMAAMFRTRHCLRIICANLGTLVDTPQRRFWALLPLPEGGDHLGLMELDGVDAVLRLTHLRDRAIGVLGLEPERDERLTGEHCHVCGLAALTASVRTNLVTCHNCRNVWDQDTFARLNNPVAA